MAMTGNGTNDALTLAQADVVVTMDNGSQLARKAENSIGLDSDSTTLINVSQKSASRY
jgi:K+-transporting ATPase ATPase B chain